MDAVTGAAIWVPALTSYGALVEVGGLRPGDDVVVTAASSGVGLAAVQIAAHLGARPIAVTRTGAKADRLMAAGARHVIAADGGDVAGRVRALTGGRGARLIFDGVAGPGLPDLAQAVAPRRHADRLRLPGRAAHPAADVVADQRLRLRRLPPVRRRGAATGSDVAVFAGGRIRHLYAFFDAAGG